MGCLRDPGSPVLGLCPVQGLEFAARSSTPGWEVARFTSTQVLLA